MQCTHFDTFIVDTPSGFAVTRLTEAVRTMGQSVSKPRPEEMRGEEARPLRSWQTSADWDFTSNRYSGILDPAYPKLLKAARQSRTAVMATTPNEQQFATQLYLLTMLTQKGARKIVRNNGFEACRQLC